MCVNATSIQGQEWFSQYLILVDITASRIDPGHILNLLVKKLDNILKRLSYMLKFYSLSLRTVLLVVSDELGMILCSEDTAHSLEL